MLILISVVFQIKFTNFAFRSLNIAIMVTTQLNAELLRNMSIIAEDENLLMRAAKYMRKLVAEKQKDSALMTEEEFYAKLDKAEKQYSQGEYTTLLPGESVTEMLKRCGYDL